MSRVVVADIFGRTPALEELCRALRGKTDIVDPYLGHCLDFEQESDAYAFFMDHIGLDAYCEVLTAKLAAMPSASTLIGFSVGASAVWRISSKLTTDVVSSAVCFYGSQIRNYLEIRPGIPIDLVFPRSEPHFCVAAVSGSLAGYENVTVHHAEYLHGFMNESSKNYNEEGCRRYVEWLQRAAG